jgi:apolipoprotein N-acyltransferase
MTPEIHWNSDDDITDTVRKISTRWIQWDQRSQMVNGMGHTSYPKVSGLTCFWAACVTHSNYRWWPFLVSLDSFCQDFFNDTSSVIIRVLMCLWICFSLFLFFFLLSLYWIRIWLLWFVNCRYYMRLSKLCYFVKFFYHVRIKKNDFTLLTEKMPF